MIQEFAKKIKFQLNTQGFHRIADFTHQANQPYFYGRYDPFRLERLVSSRSAHPAILENDQSTSHYQLDDSFYSKAWQKQSPDQLKDVQVKQQ